MAAVRHRGRQGPGVLAYDFGRIGRGVTPTPTKKQVKRLAARVRQAELDTGLEAGSMILHGEAAQDSLPYDRKLAFVGALMDALAEVCRGRPSRDQIGTLSLPDAGEWMAWLLGKLSQRYPRVFADAFPEAFHAVTGR